MKATATRTEGFTHRIDVRQHELTADEPADLGGRDQGPNPQELLAASLAACTAITIEMYAERKGWDLGKIDVECDYEQAERGKPTTFTVMLRLPTDLSDEQIERIETIAAKCPVHRTLEGESRFEQRVERL
jgi:putative redox protein